MDEDELIHGPKIAAPPPRKKPYNSRVLSVYFKTVSDLRRARKAAKKTKMPLATFIRDAALKYAEKVLAA